MTKDNLKRFVPIVNDFAQLWRNSTEQAEIAKNAGYNAVDYATTFGAPRGAFNPYRPTITPQAQVHKATVMRNQFILALNPVLTYNVHQGDDTTKIRWPSDPQLPEQIQGQVIDRTTIGYLVQRWEPAYDPGAAQQYAEEQAHQVNLFLAKERETDPQRAQHYQVFANLANEVGTRLRNGDFDTSAAATVTAQFRQVAIAASESDPNFYTFFDDHYAYEFGPLEQVTR